jgi:hypothetical protein
VEGVFSSPQLHVLTVVVMETLGGVTETVLPISLTISVHLQCIIVMIVVAVVIPCSHMSQISIKIVVTAVGWRVRDIDTLDDKDNAGDEVPAELKLPPPSSRMTVAPLSAGVKDPPTTKEVAGVSEVDAILVELEVLIGPTMTLSEVETELEALLELDEETPPGRGTTSPFV